MLLATILIMNAIMPGFFVFFFILMIYPNFRLLINVIGNNFDHECHHAWFFCVFFYFNDIS